MSRNKPVTDQVQRDGSSARNCFEFRWKATIRWRCPNGVSRRFLNMYFDTSTRLYGNATEIGFDSRASIGRDASFALSCSLFLPLDIFPRAPAWQREDSKLADGIRWFRWWWVGEKNAGQRKDTKGLIRLLGAYTRAKTRVLERRKILATFPKVHPSRADS